MTRSPLVPCPSCARHVRATEESCPFCSASIGSASIAGIASRAPTLRLSRAALVAFGTGALALTPAAGCSSSSTTFPNGGGETNYAPPYGAVPFDGGEVQPDDASLVLADAHVGTGDAGDGGVAADGADGAATGDGGTGDGESDAGDAGAED